ncbi:MAG: hypothetical protein RL292_286 [Candidatus Parcubacteria bacterium]
MAYSQLDNNPEHMSVELPTATSTDNTPAPSGKKITFSELLKQGGSYRCTVNQYVQNIESKGVVFIDKDRIRGDFSTQTQGMNIDSSLVVKDGYTYTWSSALGARGIKIKNSTPYGGAQVKGQNTQMTSTYGFNGEQIGDYDCEAWAVDESKFIPPMSITFTELQPQ